MDCVNCKQPMITAELEHVEIDFCGACGGVWLDADELESLLSDETQTRQVMSSLTAAQNCTETVRKCPICRKKMEKVNFGTVHNKVLLDRCPAHGLWFDRGELARVLENGQVDPDGKVVRMLKEMFGDMKS
ncbi:MAG: zf-TFIIB domain-containing protein [Sedimentisphaerales bacterium]|nr:zf-TFIIB domain-containing protein [Sedimentisphaerales bacterium]